MKFQRYVSSNKFLKVTRRTSRQCIICNLDISEENDNHAPLPYMDQHIVNPIGFTAFEKKVPDVTSYYQVTSTLFREITGDVSTVHIDITRKRVDRYISLVNIASVMHHTFIPLLTCYVQKKDTYKRWKHQPDVYYTVKRKVMLKRSTQINQE